MSLEDKQRVRQHMKDILLARKKQLDALVPGQEIRAKYNGEVWEATIIQIQPHQHTYPEFRLRFPGSKALYWTSGSQVILEGDEE